MSISVSIPKEGDKSRNYDELMEELLKVRCRDKGDGDTKVIDFANAEARRLERMTHIRRDTLEKIIFLFSSLVEDMEKVEMTKEEKKDIRRPAQTARMIPFFWSALLMPDSPFFPDATPLHMMAITTRATPIARRAGLPVWLTM